MANLNLHGDVSANERALVSSYKSLMAFGKLFLPRDFMKSKTPEMHYEICSELDSPSTKPLGIILPRDSAKSTIMRAKFLQSLCFAKKASAWGLAKESKNYFFGWVASNQRKSKRNIRYVRFHLKHNEYIKYFFGDGDSLLGDTDNQEEITTRYRDTLTSSSNLASMRGDAEVSEHGETVRYSIVACDDAENEQNTKSDIGRENIRDNILKGILPAIEHNPGNRLIVIGTPVHFDSFIQRLMEKWIEAVKAEGGSNPMIYTKDEFELECQRKAREMMAWHIIAYKSTQPELKGGVLWDSFMPRNLLDEKLRVAIEVGDEASYYQERELEVQHDSFALLGRKSIRYWEGYYLWEEGQSFIIWEGEKLAVNIFAGCDPATDIDTKESDFSVILVIAVDSLDRTFVLEYERHRNIPFLGEKDESGKVLSSRHKGVVDYIIELNDKYHMSFNRTHTTVEDTGITRGVFQALNSERKRLNRKNILVRPYPPGGRNKHDKIYSGLNHYFAAGKIYIRKSHYALEDEIIKFGKRMAHDDTIESLFFARINAYPCKITRGKDGYFKKKKKQKIKSWITA